MQLVGDRLNRSVSGWRGTPLWQALAGMRIEPEGAALSFVGRLASENGWDGAFAEAVYDEYLRFLYLSVESGKPLTPPDAVDQAWHLHLTYTRHYWGTLCGAVLGRPFHHGPTNGGTAEAERYRSQYGETLTLYRETFGSAAPEAVWPAAARRFSARFSRVDRGDVWVVPKARVRAGAALVGAGMLTAACQAATQVSAFEVVLVFVLLGLVALLAVSFRRSGRRNKRDGGGCGSSCGGGSSRDGNDASDSSSGCGGGCGGD